MQFGVCGSVSSLKGSTSTGLDFLEENVRDFLIPLKSDEEFASHLEEAKRCPISIRAANCFLPGALACVGPAVDIEALLSYASVAFRRAQQVGIEIIVFGSGGSRKIPEGFSRTSATEQFVTLLKQLGPLAEQKSVTVVLEPLHKGECNFLNTLAEGAELVEKADHTHVKLLADLYHIAKENETPDEILKYGKHLRHLHIAEREHRSAPGKEGDDFRPYLRALKQIGYDGRISFECGWDKFPYDIPASLEFLKKQLAE